MHESKKCYFLFGDDALAVGLRVKEIVTELNCLTVEKVNIDSKESIEKLFQLLSAQSLFSAKSLISVKINLKALKLLNEMADSFVKIITSQLAFKSIIFIFLESRVDKNVRKQLEQSELFLGVRNECLLEEFIKPNYWQTAQIKSYVLNLAAKLELRFENDALELFVEAVKDNLDIVYAELQKLKIFLLPDNCVTSEIVKKNYFFGLNIESFYEKIISRDFNMIDQVVNELSSTYSPIYLLAALQNKLRIAYKIKLFLTAKGMNASQISKLLGIHPYKVELEIKKLAGITIDYLANFISKLSDIEYKVKRGIVNVNHLVDLAALVGNSV